MGSCPDTDIDPRVIFQVDTQKTIKEIFQIFELTSCHVLNWIIKDFQISIN